MQEQRLTIRDAMRKIRSGELSSRALVDRCLDRIVRLESLIHAWVSVDADAARREAARLDELAGKGKSLGLLHGIPIGVKDIVDIAGQPTKAGSPLRDDTPAKQDAQVVLHLKRAGAILLGKTVTTEFACFDPPPTRNPWNHERSPGGSSSGSAAAVAAGMCLAAVGSQTGGSIIRPASFCGVPGFKPSHGLVSGDGVVPLSFQLDHVGPMANTAEDLLTMLAVLAGFNSQRIQSAEARLQRITETSAAPCSFIRFREYFEDRASGDVRGVTDGAIEALRSAGAEVRDISLPPSFATAHAMHRRIMAVGAAEFHQATFSENPGGYSRHIRGLIEEGLSISAVDYAAALSHQRAFAVEMRSLLGVAIALMPATSTTAPGLESTGDPGFQSPWSYAGLPAGVIPCGLAPDGLPCGLQFLGAGDVSVLVAMHWAERCAPCIANKDAIKSKEPFG